MDYLSYAAEFQPILPSDRDVVDPELLNISIPTYRLDNKKALPSKQNDNTEYSVYWGANRWVPPVEKSSIKDAYKQFISSWEGNKITNNVGDRGGLTNNGITLSTWKTFGSDKNGDGVINEKDLSLITNEDHNDILDERFWKVAKADEIYNPYLAAYVVDWMWGTGPKAFRKMHEAFGLKPQSKMTPELLGQLNADPGVAFNTLKKARKQFYRNIVKNDPSQNKFLNGWLRRADAISLDGLQLNQ